MKGSWSANLYDFLFRQYRTGHGRWTSPDPAGLVYGSLELVEPAAGPINAVERRNTRVVVRT